MRIMGKKNRNKKQRKKSNQSSDSNKNNMVMGAVLVIIVLYGGYSMLGGPGYPGQVSGYFYEDAVVSETGRVTVPEDVLGENKLVFVDVKLENVTDTFTYLGREIILTSYRGGEYLPIVVIQTPKGKTLSGVRVCEPCNSFSFSIVEGKYLRCALCGTLWHIESLQGASGGCMDYPPPKLTTGLVNGIVIETGATGLDILA
jgi:hypothetical protein